MLEFEGGVDGGDENWDLTNGNADESGGWNASPDDSKTSGILVTMMD